MTMLDDDRLASLLATAGTAFEVPPSGAADIVARAAGATAGAGGGVDGDSASASDDDSDTGNGGGDDLPTVRPVGPAGPAGRTRRVVAAARRHRVLTVAACVVVVLALAASIGAVVRGPENPTIASGLAHQHQTKGAPSHALSTTTTLPNHRPSSAGSAPLSKNFDSQPFAAANGAPSQAPQTTSPTAPSLPNDAVGQSSKIEQTGTLGLSVGRGALGRAMASLTGLAAANGGFVANSQTQSGAGTTAPYGTVTLQVPVDSFTAVLKQAQKAGRTSSLTTKATDVTGQYVDLQSRIAALQASRQQYLTILTKATSVGDVLAVQAQLNTIETQIEQLQGQLQVLTSETAYSTLTVNVSEGAPARPPAQVPESGVVRAWHDSVGGFVAGVEGIIRVAGPLLFALLCLVVVLLGGRALWRRVQRHRL